MAVRSLLKLTHQCPYWAELSPLLRILYGSRGFQIESCWKRTSVIDWTAALLPLFSKLLGCLDRNRTSVPPSSDSMQQLGRPVYTSRIPFLPAAPQFFPSSRRFIWDLEPRGLLCSGQRHWLGYCSENMVERSRHLQTSHMPLFDLVRGMTDT